MAEEPKIDEPEPEQTEESPAETGKKGGLADLVAEYGLYATATYLSTSLLVGLPAFFLLRAGVDLSAAAAERTQEAAASGNSGTWALVLGVFVILKATQIPRLAATAMAVPLVARFGRRLFGGD